MKPIFSAFPAVALLLTVETSSAWSPGVYTSPMPSKGLSVDIQNRNDVLAFWHAIYQASEGFESRPMWKEGPTANYYAADQSIPYSYQFSTTTPAPAMLKPNGVHASGELHLNFVKDVERRVNFYRALTGVSASASLMDSDTAKNSSVVQSTTFTGRADYEPPATTLKADAVQRSAYLIARTYNDRYRSGYEGWGMYHRQTNQIINEVVAWNKPAWNGNYQSNLALGFYGPDAIDQYLIEDVSGPEGENKEAGHRRFVLMPNSTNFATGDIAGSYTPGNDGAGNPEVRASSNALYVIQRPAERATNFPIKFTTYPAAGFFPAPLNSPYWSISHPNGVFTANTVVTMTAEDGTPIAVGIKTPSPKISPTPDSVAWEVLNTNATSKIIGADRKYNVTVSNFTVNGVQASYSYSVTLINPDRISSHPVLAGSAAPPQNGTAAYLFQSSASSQSVQINSFEETPAAWIENAEGGGTGIVSNTHPAYNFYSNALQVSGSVAYRLTHPVRYDMASRGVPEQSFEVIRETMPSSTGNSTLTFSYRRGNMTTASALAVEKSDDEGATWTILGVIGGRNDFSIDGLATQVSYPLAPSATPLRFRFRFYKASTGDTYNHQNYPNNPTGIFIDQIFTTNCKSLELRKTNELAPDADRFVLNSTTAGTALTAGKILHLRTRTKLGGHWFQYGPSKIVTPTATPTPGFAGWMAYEYPELTGGFNGDHDGDGIPNAIEFAFYQNPLEPGNSSDVMSVSSETQAERAESGPVLSIRREIPALRTGIDYGAEWSDNLATGSWSEQGVTVSFANGWVTATVPKGPPARFIRWKISE